MISGATRGAGGPALGRHLARASDNEEIVDLEGRGLIASDARGRVAELTRLASHARTRTPLYHVHADPLADRPWTDAERETWWSMFEAEFSLEDRPFAAVLHRKHGRLHEHRVYLRIRADGSAIRLDHDYARREKLGRRFELARGEAPVPGAHNRAVVTVLDRDGHASEAAALRDAGLLALDRPRAALTPLERHREARTGVNARQVRAVALAAWRGSDDGRSFLAALREQTLALAQGVKTLQLVDASGTTHDLRRALSAAAREAAVQSIRAADIRTRLTGLELPSVVQACAAMRAQSSRHLSSQEGPNDHDETSRGELTERFVIADETVVSRSDPRGAEGNDGPGYPARSRPEGAERGALCIAADGDDGGRPAEAAESVGSAGRGGAVRAGSDPDPFGGDRGKSGEDGDQAGVARARDDIACRRLARAVGPRAERIDRLIEALRDPAAFIARATAQLDHMAAQVDAILREEPFPRATEGDPPSNASTRVGALERRSLVGSSERVARRRTLLRQKWLDRPDVQEALSARYRIQRYRRALERCDFQIAAELVAAVEITRSEATAAQAFDHPSGPPRM